MSALPTAMPMVVCGAESSPMMQLLWGDESSSRAAYERWKREVKPEVPIVEDAGAGWFEELIESFQNSPAGASVPVQANRAQPPIAWFTHSGFRWDPATTAQAGPSIGAASAKASVEDGAAVASTHSDEPSLTMRAIVEFPLFPYQEALTQYLIEEFDRHQAALSSPNKQPLPVPPNL